MKAWLRALYNRIYFYRTSTVFYAYLLYCNRFLTVLRLICFCSTERLMETFFCLLLYVVVVTQRQDSMSPARANAVLSLCYNYMYFG